MSTVQKIDYKRELKHLYRPSAKQVSSIDVPPMNFLMIDGEGDPNSSPAYQAALEALYNVSYTLKFTIKQSEAGIDYIVMPLEGLWWAEDVTAFHLGNKDTWQWTAMIMQPEVVTPDLVEAARQQVAARKDLSGLDGLRLETFHEGQAAQILYIGPYAKEGPTIERIHRFIQEQGGTLHGKHHEIYLSDPRRTPPERFKTVIRQPYR